MAGRCITLKIAVQLTSRRRRRSSGDSSLNMLGCAAARMVCTAACSNCNLLKPSLAAALMASRILVLVSPAQHDAPSHRWPKSAQALDQTNVDHQRKASYQLLRDSTGRLSLTSACSMRLAAARTQLLVDGLCLITHEDHKGAYLVVSNQQQRVVQDKQVVVLAHVARELGEGAHLRPQVLTVLPNTPP